MKELKLIKGKFYPKEAKDIIISLIDYKIKYHHSKIISLSERGIIDSKSNERIEELKKLRGESRLYFDTLDPSIPLSIESFIKLSISGK